MGRKKREWPLFFLCLSAALYGLALIFSATRYEETLHGLVGKQAVALGGGVVLCLLLSVLDVRKLLEKLWWLLPVVNVGLLLLTICIFKQEKEAICPLKSIGSLTSPLFNRCLPILCSN